MSMLAKQTNAGTRMARMTIRLVYVLLGITSVAGALVAPAAAENACRPVGEAVVEFETPDGVEVEADYHTPGEEKPPTAILLHMIPPQHDRTNYPPEFRRKLVAAGFQVLNVDRRGAGGSMGKARDAYNGDSGKFDVMGAISFLRDQPCGMDETRLVVIGASNGSTSALDYAIYAHGTGEWPTPSRLVFLTGGNYTENQSNIADHPFLKTVPIMYFTSKKERAWSASHSGRSSAWVHQEYKQSGHGTRMFKANPSSMDDVVQFVAKSTS